MTSMDRGSHGGGEAGQIAMAAIPLHSNVARVAYTPHGMLRKQEKQGYTASFTEHPMMQVLEMLEVKKCHNSEMLTALEDSSTPTGLDWAALPGLELIGEREKL